MPDFSKVPFEAIEAITRRFDYGEARGYLWSWHEFGRGNYQTGLNDAEFVRDRLNHAIRHLFRLKDLGGSLEDLDAAICNLAMLCWLSLHGTGFGEAFPHLKTEPAECK